MNYVSNPSYVWGSIDISPEDGEQRTGEPGRIADLIQNRAPRVLAGLRETVSDLEARLGGVLLPETADPTQSVPDGPKPTISPLRAELEDLVQSVELIAAHVRQLTHRIEL